MTARKVSEFYEVSKEVIGRGAFGTVVKGTQRSNGEAVAIKIINLRNLIPLNINLIHAEVESLKCLNHPNIVKLHDFFENPDLFHICMEIVKGGELFDRITQKICYSEKDARDLILILVSTVKHCHDHSIVHRDIKAENLLMVSDEDDADIKLVDFGLATQTEGYKLDGVVGSPDYMAPEIIANKVKYGAPVDMWSLGVLSYIILVGYPPFYDTAPLRMKTKIMRGRYDFDMTYWANVSEEAKDFVSKLLTVDMETRMTATQALTHPWIALKGNTLTPRRLEDSIVELKKFNAKRRLKASCKAVLAVGKMTRLLSLTKMSTRSASFSCTGDDADDEIRLDDDEIRLDDVESTGTSEHGSEDRKPSGISRLESFDIRDHSPTNLRVEEITVDPGPEREGSPVFDNDADLECAVQRKIKELEQQNLSLKAYLDRTKDEKFSNLTGISLIQRMHEHEEGYHREIHGPVRFEESQEDFNRLTLQKNLATIKSLRMNSLH